MNWCDVGCTDGMVVIQRKVDITPPWLAALCR